jgi:hypothetical protein
MRDDRLASVLLRLYPRAWRARYGDEFLALVADTGLSWRAALDVAVAAGLERMRAIAALIGGEDPAALSAAPRRVREALFDFAAFAAVVCLTVLALGQAGAPYPVWNWWLIVLLSWLDEQTGRLADRFERMVFALRWFLAALALTGLAWLVASISSSLGVPDPSIRLYYSVLGSWFVCLGARLLYCTYRAISYNSTWSGLHPREVRAWNVVLFVVIIVMALPDDAGETFWWWAAILWMALRPPLLFRRRAPAFQPRTSADPADHCTATTDSNGLQPRLWGD